MIYQPHGGPGTLAVDDDDDEVGLDDDEDLEDDEDWDDDDWDDDDDEPL